MNFSGSLQVAARGSARPVSDRKIGSANGNRTCLEPVQYGSVRSKCFILRSPGTAGTPKTASQTPHVAARWQRTALKTRPTPLPECPSTAVRRAQKSDSERKARHAFAS